MKEEETKIYDHGFRGENVRKTPITGSGIGLEFAKLVCSLHKIGIEAHSHEQVALVNGIPYANFSVTLHIE